MRPIGRDAAVRVARQTVLHDRDGAIAPRPARHPASLSAQVVAPRSYEALRSTFRWRVPARFDISEATVGRQARRRPRALALIVEDDAGATRRCTFGEIDELANHLANVLVAAGLRPGDRLAILLSQGPKLAWRTSPRTGRG